MKSGQRSWRRCPATSACGRLRVPAVPRDAGGQGRRRRDHLGLREQGHPAPPRRRHQARRGHCVLQPEQSNPPDIRSSASRPRNPHLTRSGPRPRGRSRGYECAAPVWNPPGACWSAGARNSPICHLQRSAPPRYCASADNLLATEPSSGPLHRPKAARAPVRITRRQGH